MAAARRFARPLLLRLHARGLSVRELADRLGVADNSIRVALHAEGIATPRPPRADPIDLILARVDTSGDHWIWPGRMRKGMAIHHVGGGRTLHVARALWEHFVGDPGARLVRRDCSVARCVRPSHRRLTDGTSRRRVDPG